jgi:PAS domain S-box-containing protein
MDQIASFMGRAGFLPHGYCFNWSPGLLWTMVGANLAIASAYFSIPLAIVSFVRKREDFRMKGVAWLFCAFIFACGVTHLMGIWTLWRADYGLQSLTMVATALISLVTAVLLWPLIPKALALPSVQQLQSVIDSLEAEISKRRNAEDHLSEVQQALALTLASIGAGFIATDREGRVTRMNAVAEQATGWPQPDALGRSLWEIFVRENRPAEYLAMNPVDVMRQLGTTADQVHRVVAIARGGTRTELEIKAALTCGDDGAVRGLAMVFRDLTQLTRAEAESTRLAAIVESSSDAIIGKTLDGRITSWNTAAQTLFGYSAEEAIGQPVQMLIPGDREAEEMRILANLTQGVSVPAFDTLRRAKDGSLRQVSLTISPIRDSRGRIVGASKIVRDIAEQKRAAAALRDSEARLRFTLEAAQIGDWDLDLGTRVARGSARFARCLGRDGVDADWSFDSFVQTVHPEDRADVVRRFELAVAAHSDWHVECRVCWPDDSVHWASLHGSMHPDAGLAAHMLGIITDITQSRLAEQARLTAERLEAENLQIQQASRLKSQFLANMSHELRTPLNAVIGFADLLHSGAVPPESPKYLEFLGHIGTSGRHLLQLINDVLDLSKVESGKFEFFPEPVQLPSLIKEVGDILHTSVLRKRIQLSTQVDPGLTDLVIDPARLKQVLYNYLSNAIKFSPEGGRVAVRALAEGPQRFRIEVEDNGIGIAPADIQRLFVEFQQLDTGMRKHHQGTGLGLALTRRLVQAQGGSVGVHSTVGEGSVFHLVLDRIPAPGRPSNDASTQPVPAGSGRLLVVEREGLDQSRLVRELTNAGFAVDAASTGESALRHMHTNAYDAMTLHLDLPDRRGLELLGDIRSLGAGGEAPVLGVTLPSGGGTAAAFAVANVLSKPIRTDEIVNAMARFRLSGVPAPKVLVIDDERCALDLMCAALQAIGVDVMCEQDGREALRRLDRYRPDAVILDLMMPGFDGFAVLDELRHQPHWQHLPVFIWTSMILSDDEYDSLARSARVILSKGGGELAVMLENLRRWRPASVTLPDGSEA